MFKLQLPSKYSPLDTIHLSSFFYCSEPILMLFSASAASCFTSSTFAKCFPLRTSFIRENKKRSLGVRLYEWGVGHRGHAIFGQKLLTTQHGVGRCAPKSPIMKWVNVLKESFKKKCTETKRSLSPQGQLVH